MNKQEIFPLYVGKCNIKAHNLTYDFKRIIGNDIILERCSGELDYYSGSEVISDCTLILRSISDMSEEEWNNLFNHLGYSNTGTLPVTRLLYKSVILGNAISKEFSFSQYVLAVLWLISNGYALEESWFQGDNPIAIRKENV